MRSAERLGAVRRRLEVAAAGRDQRVAAFEQLGRDRVPGRAAGRHDHRRDAERAQRVDVSAVEREPIRRVPTDDDADEHQNRLR